MVAGAGKNSVLLKIFFDYVWKTGAGQLACNILVTRKPWLTTCRNRHLYLDSTSITATSESVCSCWRCFMANPGSGLGTGTLSGSKPFEDEISFTIPHNANTSFNLHYHLHCYHLQRYREPCGQYQSWTFFDTLSGCTGTPNSMSGCHQRLVSWPSPLSTNSRMTHSRSFTWNLFGIWCSVSPPRSHGMTIGLAWFGSCLSGRHPSYWFGHWLGCGLLSFTVQ